MAKKPNIRSLSALAFTKMGPTREEKIAESPATPIAPLSTYLPNRLAASLHPVCQHLIIKSIINEPSDSKTFLLAPDKERGTSTLAYAPAGTMLSFTFKIGPLTVNRPYSLASSPRESLEGTYRITVKRVGGGLVSNYIFDKWTIGMKVEASAPLGKFTYSPLRDAKTVIGLAGGSGITPFRSFAKAIADGDEDFNLILLYGTRTRADVIFGEEFKELEKKTPKFKMINVLSDEEVAGIEHGFITADLIRKYAPEGDYSIFACGPQAMYNFLDKELPKLGIRKKFIRMDCYGEIHDPSKMSDYPTAASKEKTFKLTVHQEGKISTISCTTGESLLVSMEKAGLAVPAHCRSGICGYCHSHLLKGEVYTPARVDGRRMADSLYGYIHPCVAFPLSDITIEVEPVK